MSGQSLGDGELGAANLLAAKKFADSFNGGMLVIQVGLKMQFHNSLSTCESGAA